MAASLGNSYGRQSKLQLMVGHAKGRTFIRDLYFTAPFKIMKPFVQKNHLKAILLAVSAGILSGDEQELCIDLEENACFELTSQSYEKIQSMPQGKAVRQGTIYLAPQARFYYHPLPVLPFTDARFQQHWKVVLTDTSSRFLSAEILSCGRAARAERFCYREYRSLWEIYRGEALVYEDNTCYCPAEMSLDDVLQYEGYTHLLSMVWLGMKTISVESVRQNFQRFPDVLAGASKINGGICIKALANGSEDLLALEKILTQGFFSAE